MLGRRLAQTIISRLERMPAVVLLGPRQVGKTTLAKQLAKCWPTSHYVDLETSADRDRLKRDPRLYLKDHADDLVILDEVQRVPGLFQELRGIIDRGARGTAERTAGSCCSGLPRRSSWLNRASRSPVGSRTRS